MTISNNNNEFKTQTAVQTQDTDAMKWRYAVESSNIGLWDWNIKTNEIYYSPECKQLMGYEDHEFKNEFEAWQNIIHPDDSELTLTHINLHLKNQLENYKSEHRLRCKDGQYKWFLDRGRTIEINELGEPTRMIGTLSDISQLKESEEQIRESLDLITAQNARLESFVNIVSHDLNSHVSNFSSILELHKISQDDDEKEELIQFLHTISKTLIESISGLNKIINLKADISQCHETVNLNQLTEVIISDLRFDIQSHNVTVLNKIEKDTCLETNETYIKSIIYNLISNAIKYRRTGVNPEITLETRLINNNLQLLISDNGIGIDIEKHGHKLFKLYSTFHGTKRTDSNGIGLYLIKTQIETLGGSVEVDSKLNKGTVFKINFNRKRA